MTLYTLTAIEHTYGPRTVLKLPSMSIHAGEIVAIVGPSGAGKSTLLRLLSLLEAPTQGQLTVKLNGKDVNYHTASIHDRRQIVMAFQRPVLLSRSVCHNVAYGLRLRGLSDGAVDTMLDKMGLSELANTRADTLSGGELQRVAIARALILKPDIMLLDEPTANLDPYNVKHIESALLEGHRQQGNTLIIVTHNIFQARRLATRVALLIDGQLVEIGPAKAFFEQPQNPRTAAFISGDYVY